MTREESRADIEIACIYWFLDAIMDYIAMRKLCGMGDYDRDNSIPTHSLNHREGIS